MFTQKYNIHNEHFKCYYVFLHPGNIFLLTEVFWGQYINSKFLKVCSTKHQYLMVLEENDFVVKQACKLYILYFLEEKNHIKCLSKDYQKSFILSNSMYLILCYRTPIPNTYCRCNSTLADVALTKRRGFKNGNVSIVAGVWLSSKASSSACCPTSCLLFFGFNMVLFSRIENP